jgi:cell wall-associated NlpC family hydrolase
MPQPGDYGCVSTNGRIGRIIRLFLRSKVNHVFIYIGGGKIIEARPSGAAVSDIHYSSITWSTEKLTQRKRTKISVSAALLVGTPYGFLDIFFLWLKTLGVTLPYVSNWVLRDDRMICSQLVAHCYAKAGITLVDKPENEVTPKDLYERARDAI